MVTLALAAGFLSPSAFSAFLAEAFFAGECLSGADALKKAGLEPVVLAAKEGLALINGTQTSTALALAGLFRAHRAAQSALITGAMSTDAAMGSSAPFHPDIHTLRGHRGQIDTAAALRALLDNSVIRQSHIEGDERVQDPYCIRCQPQVDGACLDLLRSVARTLEIEANAVTDNPLVLSDNSVVSGGNFHAEPVAFAADQIAIAVCEIGAIATEGGMGSSTTSTTRRTTKNNMTTTTIVTIMDTASETLAASLPVVLSVTDQSGAPRYPSFKNVMAAKKKPVEQWSLADLQIDPAAVGQSAARTTITAVHPSPPRERGQIITDDDSAYSTHRAKLRCCARSAR